jgi:hypothetical protein
MQTTNKGMSAHCGYGHRIGTCLDRTVARACLIDYTGEHRDRNAMVRSKQLSRARQM